MKLMSKLPSEKRQNHLKVTEEGHERSRQLIVNGIFLYTTCKKQPLSYTYEIGNTSQKTLKISLDFARSVNFTPVDDNETTMDDERLSAVVTPYSRIILGTMNQGSTRMASRLAVDCYYELIEVDKAEVKAAADCHMAEVQKLVAQSSDSDSGSLYIDKSFPPSMCCNRICFSLLFHRLPHMTMNMEYLAIFLSFLLNPSSYLHISLK